MTSSVQQITRCKCGSVVLSINLPPTLGFVCYSEHYEDDNSSRIDLTQFYPSVVKMAEGATLIPCSVGEDSPVRRVFASCCNTHMFDCGSVAAMLEADLLDEEDEFAVHFRVMASDSIQPRDRGKNPPMSWRIPLAWMWTSPGDIDTERVEPTPADIGMATMPLGLKDG